MPRRGRTRQRRRSTATKAARRGVAVGAAAGAFLAFGVSPPATADADLFDLIVDPIVDLMSGTFTVPDSLLDSSAGSPEPLLAAALPADSMTDLWTQIHAAGQSFIEDPANAEFLAGINQPFVEWFGRELIGNGLDDFTGSNTSVFGSTGLFGDLGDGGFLFGDGGDGAAAVVSGGHGGDGFAGGDGGNGGDGGAGGNGTTDVADSAGGAGGGGGHGGSAALGSGNGGANGTDGITPGSGGGGCGGGPGVGGPGGPGSGTGNC
ncbi:hypothetical protein MSP7336_00808 [Mycobacterium shimoidei]|uniref:PE-PGRS family protein n=1 Tax=Mycobacterium shimoidei TaxID=29313 RepID=A0A375YUR9_MYCSH|nr:hypothetical protein [Mycobacterium shimoidei]SRX92582.1 hypothetical protein MSP7336_00808 [Mycobacterium shimoidei]